VWLTTEVHDQSSDSSLHCVTVPTDVTSGHIGRRDASRGGSYRLAQKAAECVEVPVLRKRGSPGYIRCLLRTTMTDRVVRRVRVLLARRAPADTCCYCARPRVCGHDPLGAVVWAGSGLATRRLLARQRRRGGGGGGGPPSPAKQHSALANAAVVGSSGQQRSVVVPPQSNRAVRLLDEHSGVGVHGISGFRCDTRRGDVMRCNELADSHRGELQYVRCCQLPCWRAHR